MASPPPPPELPPQKSMKWLWLLLGGGAGCLVICGGLAGALGYFGVKVYKDVVRPIHALNKAVTAGDHAAAYAEMSEAYRKANSKEEFTRFVKAHSTVFPGEFKPNKGFHVQNDTGKLNGEQGGTGVEYGVVKVSGRWWISHIKVRGMGSTPGEGLRMADDLERVSVEDKGSYFQVTWKGAATSGMRLGTDGKTDIVLDVRLTDPKGRVLREKKALLNYRNKSSRATWTVTLGVPGPLQPGNYELTLTVHDNIGGADMSRTYATVLEGR